DRKRFEGLMDNRSEELYRLITENTSDMISVLDLEGNFIYASPSFRKVLGYDPEDLVGSNSFSLIHPDDKPAIASAFQEALFNKEGSIAEYRYKHRSGEWRTLEAVGSWIFNERGSPQRGVIASRDITERKRAEEALRESEERFRIIAEMAPVMIWMSSPGRFYS